MDIHILFETHRATVERVTISCLNVLYDTVLQISYCVLSTVKLCKAGVKHEMQVNDQLQGYDSMVILVHTHKKKVYSCVISASALG